MTDQHLHASSTEHNWQLGARPQKLGRQAKSDLNNRLPATLSTVLWTADLQGKGKCCQLFSNQLLARRRGKNLTIDWFLFKVLIYRLVYVFIFLNFNNTCTWIWTVNRKVFESYFREARNYFARFSELSILICDA